MTRFFVFFALLCCFPGQAQTQADSLVLHLVHKFGPQKLELHRCCYAANDTVEIASLKYYISDIEIEFLNKSVARPNKKYHLIDLDEPKSLAIPITTIRNMPISKITFKVGVDSLASVSGAMSGDLDPSRGMYWAWQSGYINMKIEGKSNSCPTRKHQFHFHLGGYRHPYNTLRTVTLLCQKPENQIYLDIDLKPFFSAVQLAFTQDIMVPGKEAMALSDLIPAMFTIR